MKISQHQGSYLDGHQAEVKLTDIKNVSHVSLGIGTSMGWQLELNSQEVAELVGLDAVLPDQDYPIIYRGWRDLKDLSVIINDEKILVSRDKLTAFLSLQQIQARTL